MITHDLTAAELLSLGRCACTLENGVVWNAHNYLEMRDLFLTLLARCNFQSSLATAQCIAGIKIMQDVATGRVEANQAAALRIMCEGIYHSLRDEAQRTAVILTNARPPAELLALTNLKPHQEDLKKDLIVCLKAHLARPAIVTAWALGYDMIRTWVCDDQPRLDAFNKRLAATKLKREPDSIDDYHDFFRVDENRFLEICRDSQELPLQRFTGKTYRKLQGLLDKRNNFAHPNYSKASEHFANAFVVELIDILQSEPFFLSVDGERTEPP